MDALKPGKVALLGSGETTHSGGQLFEALAQGQPRPVRVSVLETPAGYELNSDRVAGRVADFIRQRLQNYQPEVTVVPARKRGTPQSPENPSVNEVLLHSHLIYMGAGSPTYAVRQLRDSLAWDWVQARHRLGADVILTSAATLAVSAFSLPVYEIYKVGEDPHWKRGLDFFRPFGLNLVVVPHWNNTEGGDELDTSHCFMGAERFAALKTRLPADSTILGVDERTAVILGLSEGTAQVMGAGGVTLGRGGAEQRFENGSRWPLSLLGAFQPLTEGGRGLRAESWERALRALEEDRAAAGQVRQAPEVVLRLAAERQQARELRDWAEADRLRGEIQGMGWQVMDTPEGPRLEALEK